MMPHIAPDDRRRELWVELSSVHEHSLAELFSPRLIYARQPDVKWLKGRQRRYFLGFHRHHWAVARKIVRKSRGDLASAIPAGSSLYGGSFGADLVPLENLNPR
jgi:hypothetical protein